MNEILNISNISKSGCFRCHFASVDIQDAQETVRISEAHDDF